MLIMDIQQIVGTAKTVQQLLANSRYGLRGSSGPRADTGWSELASTIALLIRSPSSDRPLGPEARTSRP